MPKGVKLNVDATEFLRALKAFARDTNLEMAWVCRWQMALWVKDLIQKTGGNPSVKDVNIQKKQGENAIKRDVKKLFVGFNDISVLSRWREESQKSIPLWKTSKTGRKFCIYPEQFVQSDAEAERVHKRYRDSRGRVNFDPGLKRSAVGWGGKFIVPSTQLVGFRKRLLTHVFKTKAGWMRAARYFNDQVKNIVSVPWHTQVSRHESWAAPYGVFSDTFGQMSAHKMIGEVQAGNNVPWVHDAGGMMQATLRTRVRDLSLYAEKRLAAVAKRYNYIKGVYAKLEGLGRAA